MHLGSVHLLPERFPGRDIYPFNLPVFQHTRSLRLRAPITLFVGENGTGKSTLLEAICRRCGVHIWRDDSRSRFEHNPYERDLYKCLTVQWTGRPVPGAFFGSDIFRGFAETLDQWAQMDPGQLAPFGGRSPLNRSHGQGLLAYFRNRYRIRGLYFLDEPETALSPSSQLELLRILSAAARAGHAQFLLATHSPILLACPDADIVSFDHVPLRRIAYRETPHYKLYRAFLEDPESHLPGGG